MSIQALLAAVVTELQTDLSADFPQHADNIGNFIAIQPNGNPPATAGEWYVSVDGMSVSSDARNFLRETYNVKVYISKKTAKYDTDRMGKAYSDNAEGLEQLELRVRGHLHANENVRITANTNVGAPGPGGDVFQRPLYYQGRSNTRYQDSGWNHSKANKRTGTAPDHGWLVRELTFTGADRIQALNVMLGSVVAPDTLQATSSSETEVDLTWDNAANNSTGVLVYRSTNGVTFSQITSLANTALSYSDTTTVGGTIYYYRVVNSSALGNSGPSNTANIETQINAPETLTAVKTNELTGALSWTNESDGETGFQIERSTDDATFVQIGTTASNVYTYDDVTTGGTFYYRVRTFTSEEESTYTNTASVTLALNAPSSLTATPSGENTINVAYTDNSSHETEYSIERSSDSGSTWGQVGTVGANVTSYSDTTTVPGISYEYRARAGNGVTFSAYSNTATAENTLNAPTSLTAVEANETTINLSWTDNSANEDHYYVEHSADGVTFSALATIAANSTTYADSTLSAGTIKYYRVRAGLGSYFSSYSNTANDTTPVLAPSALSVTVDSTETKLNLSWTVNSASGSVVTKVERSTDNSTWSLAATVAFGTAVYQDTGLNGGTLYYYRIRSAVGSVFSSYTSSVSQDTLLLAPTTLVATANSSDETEIGLTWNDNSSYETGYRIENSLDNVTFSLVTTLAANSTSYNATALSGAQLYYFRVRANGTNANSTWATASATTIIDAPSSLTAGAADETDMNLGWTNNTAAASLIDIEKSLDGSSWSYYGQVTSLDATTVTGLNASTLYYFRIRATNGTLYSAYSSTASADTILNAPTTLSITSQTDTTVGLSWVVNSAFADTSVILTSTDDVTFSEYWIGGVTTSTTYTHTPHLPEGPFYFEAENSYAGIHASAPSNVISTAFPPYPPNTLSVVADATAGQEDLSWTNGSSLEPTTFAFRIYGSDDGGSTFSLIGQTGDATTTSLNDTSLSSGFDYFYYVTAYQSGVGESVPSNTADATTN